MAKYSGPGDIYKELVEDSEESWLHGLVAFAVVEEQRIEWMRHQKRLNGVDPASREIQAWYEQQPEGVLLRAKGTAEHVLMTYSEEVYESALADQIEQFRDGQIVAEIRQSRAFWPQFGVNVAGGFAGALLLAVILALFAFVVVFDTSPAEIGSGLKCQVEGACDE